MGTFDYHVDGDIKETRYVPIFPALYKEYNNQKQEC